MIKNYSFASIIYILLVAMLAMATTGENHAIQVYYFGLLDLPIAVWMVLPLVIFFILSLLHIIFYKILYQSKQKYFQKDLKTIKPLIIDLIFANKSKIKFLSSELKSLATFLKSIDFSIDADYKSKDEAVMKALKQVQQINNGDFVEGLQLAKDSKLYKQNKVNQSKNDEALAMKILQDETFDLTLQQQVLQHSLQNIDLKQFQKIPKNLINNQINLAFLQCRLAQDNDLVLNDEDIIELSQDFESKDFIKLAKLLKNNIKSDTNPDQFLELFYKLSQKYKNANEAYLYANLDFGKTEFVHEYLENFTKDEMKSFRYYLVLKQTGINVVLEDFI